MIFEDEPVPGYPLPILPGHTSPGRLERVLRAGAFAVTTELDPPDSADPEDVYRRARVFDGYVDAINATDGSGANCHMSSLAVCALLTRVGYAPVMQISCRDRNRIAIQGDILGGAAMGVCNVLCLTGDGVQSGDHPQAKPVFDLDSTSLLGIARVGLHHLPPQFVVTEPQGPILADHTVDVPLPRNEIAPPSRTTRDRDDCQAGRAEIAQRCVYLGRQASVLGQCVVNVRQHRPRRTGRLTTQSVDRQHQDILSSYVLMASLPLSGRQSGRATIGDLSG